MPSAGKEDGAGYPASEITMDDENFRTGGLKASCLLRRPADSGKGGLTPCMAFSFKGLGHLWSCSCSSSFA